MSAIGFDIGNETCYIAAARSGGIDVLDNEYSLRATPLYIGFTQQSREVGVTAKIKIVPNICNTIFNFKTLLGKLFFEEASQKELEYLPYNVLELSSGEVGVNVKYLNKDATFSVQQIMAIMFNKLKSIAETKTNVMVKDCVISVPVFFTDRQRRALLDSAEIAGLKTLRLFNETTAAALIYGYYKQDLFQTDEITVAFIDFGQSALTVTVCNYHQDKMNILGTAWNTRVGGREFDVVLVKYFAEEFKKLFHVDVYKNKKALMALIVQCETLKKQMSGTSQQLEINIECLMNDTDVKGKMKREQFENLSSNILSSIERTLTDAIEKINVNSKDISSVQIIGGSSRIPAFKSIVEKVFGLEPQTTLNQDEAVARGCSLQCALLSPTLRAKPFQVEDIQPYGIKVIHKGENFEEEIIVFNRFQKIPSIKAVTFSFKGDFILEAFYENLPENVNKIGQAHFTGIPLEVKQLFDVKLKIKLSINHNGLFNVNSAKIIGKLTAENNEENPENKQIIPYDESNETAKSEKDETVTDESSEKLKSDEVTNVKVYNLEVITVFPELKSDEIFKCIQNEKEMEENDLIARRMADLRNEVEEYIYFVREKLDYELSAFIGEETKSILIAQMTNTEHWLYEDQDSINEDDLCQRLGELKRQFEPIHNFYLKIQEIQKLIEQFQTLLLHCAQHIQSIGDSKQSSQETLKELKEHWDHANNYMQNVSYQMGNVKSSKDLSIAPEDICKQMKILQDKILLVHNMSEMKIQETSENDTDAASGESVEQQKPVLENLNTENFPLIENAK